MQPYPHIYTACAMAEHAGSVSVISESLPELQTSAPPEFDGPGGMWSPETLLCAAVADCFILTFRAVTRAARFEWARLECRVEGTLERVAGVSEFTRYKTIAKLTIAASADRTKAQELLHRAEKGCLVANSLRGMRTIETEILTIEPAASTG